LFILLEPMVGGHGEHLDGGANNAHSSNGRWLPNTAANDYSSPYQLWNHRETPLHNSQARTPIWRMLVFNPEESVMDNIEPTSYYETSELPIT